MAINTSHPIGSKVRWAIRPSDSLNEQITGVAAGGTIGTTVELSEGTAYIPSTSYTEWATNNSALDTYSHDVTFVWYGRVNVAGAGAAVIGSFFHGYGWEAKVGKYDTSVIYVQCITRAGGGLKEGFASGIVDNTVHSIVFRFKKSDNTLDIWVDGVAKATDLIWGSDGGAAGTSAKFRMLNTATVSHAVITAQVYDSYLSDAELSSLASDPMQVFESPGINLTVAGANQLNSVSTGAIGVGGVIYIDPLTQNNSLSSVRISREQDVTPSSMVQTNSVMSVSVNAYTRLKELAAAAPLYTWFPVNTTRYVDCQMALADRPYNYPADYDHLKVIHPWSSFAFDYDQARILLWGGGHGVYTGNQLYIWNGDTGAWELACLPSALDSDPNTRFIVDGKAPQSSHTYHNNLWLKGNNMFATFGGASTPSGGPFLEAYADEDGQRRVAPWLYDLNKIDSEKVGGSDGSGMNPARLGLNAWQHRRDKVPTGELLQDVYPLDYAGHAQNAAVSITKNGKDYAVFTLGGSFPLWYRYEFGDVRAGESDTIKYLGRYGSIDIKEGWMVYDSNRDLVYRNAYAHNDPANYTNAELAAKNPWIAGTSNAEAAIRLVHSGTGTPFEMQKNETSQECPYGAAYDSIQDCLWLWSGALPDTGVIYRVNIPEYNPTTGWAATTWTVDTITPAGQRPYGQYPSPLLGKLKYVPEVGALITLDNGSNDGVRDATVWMFKTAELSDWTPPSASMFNVF